MVAVKLFSVICIVIFILPCCASFNWVGLPTTKSGAVVPPTSVPQATFRIHNNPELEELKGFIQIKASKQKNSKSTTFDLSKLQEYLKGLDHQLKELQTRVASIEQQKHSNGLGESNPTPGTILPQLPGDNGPACPPCITTCPACPLPSCSSPTVPTTRRSVRSTTTKIPVAETEENYSDLWY